MSASSVQASQLPLQHVPQDVVSIDKTANTTTSMQARRRRMFWTAFDSKPRLQLGDKVFEAYGL